MIGGFLGIHRNEVLLAYAADRANLQRCIEDLPADQTFHKLSGSCGLLLGILLLKERASEIISILIGIQKLCFAGLKPYTEAVHNLHPKLL